MTAVALVEYYVDDPGTLVFLLKPGLPSPLVFQAGPDPDGRPLTAALLKAYLTRILVDFHGLPPNWDVGPDVGNYRTALSLPPSVNAAKRSAAVLQRKLETPAFSYEMTYLEQLADALFPATMRAELDDCDVLCIVPYGPLHGLPFAALRWTPDQFLSERFGLCQLPAANLLRHCRLRHQARTSVPDRPRSCYVAALAAREDSNPDDLECDAIEVADIFTRHGGLVQTSVGATGARPASKALVRASLRDHDIVHFACHGLFGGGGDPMGTSGLLLSDGASVPSLGEFGVLDPGAQAARLLNAREIMALRIEADLVTLRACSSGRAELRVGDELLGLIRAFFYAGTASVIASLWNVNKLSSRALLHAFYRAWLGDEAEPASKWQAMQAAQAVVRETPGYGHPYHWAAFVLIGSWQ